MNNRKYNILLARIMMLPFIKPELDSNDYFFNYASAYKSLINYKGSTAEKEWRNVKSDYKNALDRLKIFALDDVRWNHVDDLSKVLDVFFPGKKLSSLIDEENKDIDAFYINYILEIARVFITFRDGDIAIRNWSKEKDPFLNNYSEYEKIDLWNNITRTVTTDLFIAATYVNFDVDVDNIFNVPNLVSLADMPLRVILSKGVAETHMHANAGISYERVWRKQMQFCTTREKKVLPDQTNLWFCTFFRYFSAMFIKTNNKKICFDQFVFCCINEDDKFEWFTKQLQEVNDTFSPFELKDFCIRNKIATANSDSDILFEKWYSIHKDKGVSAEILWYIDVLKYLKDNHDRLLCQNFMHYLRIKNSFFSNKIQQTRIHGLDYFTLFFDNATGTDVSYDKNKFYYIFEEQFKYGNMTLLEMKISPKLENNVYNEEQVFYSLKRKTLKQIQSIIRPYRDYLLNYYNDSESNFPQIGLVYHFIKKEDSDNFSSANCILSNEDGDLTCNDYNSMRRKNIVFMKALNQLLFECPILTDYIVGIDAAAKENATEPWVFAPVFKTARSSKKIIPYVQNKDCKIGKIQNLGFTYHVGEDFRHIVSGLRHIDEVLTHFNYRSGDRLGHALALGVDIDYLVSLNSIVAIPIMEYLENLLWMWQYVNSTGDIGSIPDNLEFKIMETARQIYNSNINGIDVYTLWRVYQDKFKQLKDIGVHSKDDNGNCNILNKISNNSNKWEYNELLMSHFCPCFYELYHKPIFVKMNTNVEFYKELQQSLIKKVERMGVYVETNPTSNTAIGDIPSIFEHPIIRLNNRGLNIPNSKDSCVLVSINSDDPLVFSTHVENEISYIYYSLLNVNCRREEALEWIDKIRMHGINSSFIKNRKKYKNELLRDLNIILDLKID